MFPISFCMTILEGLILIYIDLCVSSQFLKNQFVQVLMLWWSQYLDQIFHARLVFWWTIFHFSAFDTIIKEWASLELGQKMRVYKKYTSENSFRGHLFGTQGSWSIKISYDMISLVIIWALSQTLINQCSPHTSDEMY